MKNIGKSISTISLWFKKKLFIRVENKECRTSPLGGIEFQ
jgi:hypothetical protein